MPATYRHCCCGLQSPLGAHSKGRRFKLRRAGVAASKVSGGKFLSAALMACMRLVDKVHPRRQNIDPD